MEAQGVDERIKTAFIFLGKTQPGAVRLDIAWDAVAEDEKLSQELVIQEVTVTEKAVLADFYLQQQLKNMKFLPVQSPEKF